MVQREFAFPLPLAWPLDNAQRKAYERDLIEYAALMRPLVDATTSDKRQELLDVLSQFAAELRKLWARRDMPAEIRQFLTMFE
jgi:hypothetical protein